MRLIKTMLLPSLLILTNVSTSMAANQSSPGGIKVGGFLFVPAIDIDQRYDDNLLRETDDPVESWGTLLQPSFILKDNNAINDFQLGYALKRGEYYSSEADNYTDHRIWTNLDYELNSQHKIILDAEYEDGHDARGTRYSIGHGDELASPDTYQDTLMALTYRYGGRTAPATLDLRYKYKGVNYDGTDVDYLERDRDTHIIGSTFYYQVAPFTDLLLDVSRAEVNYDFTVDAANSLDSSEEKALVGIKWESSAATEGFAKVGIRSKEFDSGLREKFNGFDWEVGVNWQPVEYTRFLLSTASDIKEAEGEGNFIEKRDYLLSWQHDWSNRVNTELELLYQDDIYNGIVSSVDNSRSEREDNNWGSKLAAYYQMRRWLQLSVAYRYEQRDSNRNSLNFDRNLISFSITASL